MNESIPEAPVFNGAGRMSAVGAMRERAKYYRRLAAGWEHLAETVDSVGKYAKEINGCGDGPVPFLGEGSPGEGLLWDLATRKPE